MRFAIVNDLRIAQEILRHAVARARTGGLRTVGLLRGICVWGQASAHASLLSARAPCRDTGRTDTLTPAGPAARCSCAQAMACGFDPDQTDILISQEGVE